MIDTTDVHDGPDSVSASRAGYACGRLLAILAAVDAVLNEAPTMSPAAEAFTAAAARPARTFGPLLMRTLPELMTATATNPEPDMLSSLSERLDETIASLGAQFPTALSPEGQAAFALGFLQERMTHRQLVHGRASEPEQQDVLIEEDYIDPADIFPDDL